MLDYLPLLPWLFALVVVFGLRRELAARLREIALFWGLPVRSRKISGNGMTSKVDVKIGEMPEEELREIVTRYAQAPSGTRAAVRKLLAP